MKSINDLDRIDPEVRDEILRAVVECVQSGWYVLGRNVAAFEEEFARYIGGASCVSVANGTEALEIALRSLGVESGDRVVTVANAGFYSSIGILACGAVPVYADIDPETYTMSPDSLKPCLESGAKAVILTHLYGRMGDIAAISSLCERYGVPLVEDCAQAHGARSGGRMAGSFGLVSCFSFYPTKNLGAMGDGGALVSSDPSTVERIRRLRQYGWSSKYRVDLPYGKNSRLDEMQAAILRVKLKYLDRWNGERRRVASRYDRGIRHAKVVRRGASDMDEYVAHLYVIEAEERDALQSHLKAAGVPCDVHYPLPDHRQKRLGALYAGLSLECSEKVAGRVLTLPCFPEMTDGEVDSVIAAVNGWGG